MRSLVYMCWSCLVSVSRSIKHVLASVLLVACQYLYFCTSKVSKLLELLGGRAKVCQARLGH